jgi:hypothetical protein
VFLGRIGVRCVRMSGCDFCLRRRSCAVRRYFSTASSNERAHSSGLYFDSKWLSWIDHGALHSSLCSSFSSVDRSRRRARSMFSSPSIPSNALRCEGRTHPRMKNAPPSRARPREGERRCLWSPGLMGGLAGGRVRSRNRRGIPKKESRSRNSVIPV